MTQDCCGVSEVEQPIGGSNPFEKVTVIASKGWSFLPSLCCLSVVFIILFSSLFHSVGGQTSLGELVAPPEDKGLGTDAEAVVCDPSRDSVQWWQVVIGQSAKSHELLQAMEEFQISNILDVRNWIGKMGKQPSHPAGSPARGCATTIMVDARSGAEEVEVQDGKEDVEAAQNW